MGGAAGRGRRSGKLTALVREYLESDFEKQAEICDECPVEEESRDECGYCEVCKFRPIEERFDTTFRLWVANLTRLHLWRAAGYPLRANELDFEEWNALALITRFYEVRDKEAAIPRVEG